VEVSVTSPGANPTDGEFAAGSRAFWRQCGVILLVAIVLRGLVAFVFLGRMPMVDDAVDYYQFGVHLLQAFPGERSYYWPPGTSLILAGTFSVIGISLESARLAMLACSVGCVVFCLLITYRLTDNVTARRAAGWFAALYVPAVLFTGQARAQHPSALFLLAMAYFALRAAEKPRFWRFALTGAAFAMGSLTRPSALSAGPFVVALWFLVGRIAPMRRLAGTVVFLCTAGAILAPVLWHNASHGAGMTLSTNNERNFFLGNNPYTPDYKTWHLGQRDLSQVDAATAAYLRSYYARPDARSAMTRAALDFIRQHPGRSAVRTLNRATSFWGFDYLASRSIQNYAGWSSMAVLPLLALEAGSYAIVMLLFLYGALAARATVRTICARWLLVVCVAYTLPYLIAFSGGTYHFPVMGLLVPFAAVGFASLRESGGVRSAIVMMLRDRRFVLAAAVFLLIQVQYAYYIFRMTS
jgi:4-amino-4-deoxy-L-arabinose transferase-like glycosyltransferase